MTTQLYCKICYSTDVEEECVCEKCEEHFCWDCSITFTIHNQCDSNLCYHCGDEPRRSILTKSMIRENKLKLVLT